MDSSPQLSTPPGHEQPQLPLSYGQEQLWFLEQLFPGEPTYNVSLVYRLRGRLDTAVLHDCLVRVVKRHDVLRATIRATEDGTPIQVVAPAGDVALRVSDLGGHSEGEREEATRAALAHEVSTPFDFRTGPLYRFRLLRLAPEEHVLCLTVHHIVTDGWSMAMLNNELSTTYRALLRGDEPELPEPAVQYADYVAWQRRHLGTEVLDGQLEYWEKALANLPTLELPTDRPRPPVANHRGSSFIVDFSADLLPRLRTLARAQGASVFMVLTSAVNVVLARYTGQEDVPIGVTMLGRTEPDFEDVVGLFANMVVLRTDLSGEPTFAEVVERVASASVDAYDNQDVPFERVVERVQPVRDPSRNPLFQVSVQMLGDSNSGAQLDLAGVAAEKIDLHTARSRFDLCLTFLESTDSLQLDIEYSTELFDEWRVRALAAHVERVLAAACAEPSVRVSQVPLLTEAERDELLACGRGERVDYDRDPVHLLIGKTAAAHPDQLAVTAEGRELTYRELDRRAGQLARYLRAQGLRHGQVVVVAMERDVDAFVALVGVLKAGGAFACLDTTNPVSRQDFILHDTGAPLVLTQSAVAGRLPEPDGWRVVALDAAWDDIESIPADEPLEEWTTGDSLAYVLYTSGSTGTPKGTLIEHRALVSFIHSYQRVFDLGPQDRMLQFAAHTFDMAQGELFTGLVSGATLVPVPREVGTSLDLLTDLMRRERVTYICLPPTLMALMESEPYPDLRKIMVGGEAVPGDLVNRWNLPGRRFVNVYGPTEATVGCTSHECEHVVWRTSPPIGAPLLDRDLYVVDRWGNLVPRGVPGELLIGGDEGLARGYLNRPELTTERFVPDPFHPGMQVYRSGDLVRWNAGSRLEFLGRLDNQIKLRGLRIELEEIESVLLKHPDVEMAVVGVRPDRRGDAQLVGYLTAAPGREPKIADLRRHLADRLPEYMVPAAWVVLDEFPLTMAGKVNRNALPAPAESEDEPDEVFVPPQTATEAKIADTFAEILGLPRVARNANFFDLGGNSLQAMRVVGRLSRTFGIKVNVRVLYGTATVSAVAEVIDEKLGIVHTPPAGSEEDLLARVEGMSDEEAERLLAATAESAHGAVGDGATGS
jgi:amino acid adenylation domain-containing protein